MIGEDGRNSNKIMYVNYLYRLREVKAPVGYRINKEYSYIEYSLFFIHTDVIINSEVYYDKNS